MVEKERIERKLHSFSSRSNEDYRMEPGKAKRGAGAGYYPFKEVCRYDLSSLPEVYKQKIIYATIQTEQQTNEAPIANPPHIEGPLSSGHKKRSLSLINSEFFNSYFKTASISF